jgi:hypothetical protein
MVAHAACHLQHDSAFSLKLKIPKRDENDIPAVDPEVERACNSAAAKKAQ